MEIISKELAFNQHQLALKGYVIISILLIIVAVLALFSYSSMKRKMKTKNKIDAWLGIVSIMCLVAIFSLAAINEYTKGPRMLYKAEFDGVEEILNVDINIIKERASEEGFKLIKREGKTFLLTDEK